MSIEALTYALSLNVGDSTRKLVLVGLANHAHKDGTRTWASLETVAVYANCSARTVQRHIGRLLDDGHIREGDQSILQEVRRDRRPIVYDVAMDEKTRAAWAGQQVAGRRARDAERGRRRGDSSAPRGPGPGDSLTPGRGEDLTPGDGSRGDKTAPDEVTKTPPRGDTAMSPKPSTEPTTEPTTGKASTDVDAGNVKQLRPRKPDVVFDALLAVCNPGVQVSDMTKSEHGKYSRAAAELREAGRRADRTDEQIAAAIPERARAYDRRWPGTLTALALVGHWAELRPPPRAQGRAVDR